MSYSDKEEQARELVQDVLAIAKRPAIMCSFGKDSMVVLHLLRSEGMNLPVIFHREPFLPRKYSYANRIIEEWNLTVYDFPANGTAVQQSGAAFEVMNYYPGGKKGVALPTGLCAPAAGEAPLCALHDFYLKPVGAFAYPWDYVFHGHKSSDVDPIYGHVPLAADIGMNIESVSAAFPIREFTDEDVWAYIERHDVPIHVERYEKVGGAWREREDKRKNPDYFPACWGCMVQGGGPVACPRLGGRTVSNIADQLRWAPKHIPEYMAKT